MRSSLAAIALLTVGGCAATPPPVIAPLTPPALFARTFGETPRAQVRSLIVVLHGDAPAAPPGYQYDFAEKLADDVADAAVVTLLRPGYTDPQGNRSPGERGQAIGDNYTSEQVAAVADSIVTVKRQYPSARTILVGHSGGGAVAANIAGTRPGLLDGMVLVSCPCALPEWRKHMKTLMPNAPWNTPVQSLDPLKTVGGISPTLRAAVLVGSDDKITPPRFSRSYVEALTLRGIATDYRILPGKGHEILDDPQVLAAITRMAASFPEARR